MANGSKSSGIGFVGGLQLLFIGLKLTGFIDWSWYVVLSPLIVEAVLIMVLLILLFLVDD